MTIDICGDSKVHNMGMALDRSYLELVSNPNCNTNKLECSFSNHGETLEQ